ncbi:MAG: PAS domain-containing protein [Clostridia bacterium]|nr:PAS domain-containing protein [Clostridia bacterium]
MKNMFNNMEEILSRNIPGFHQYVLREPVHLSYVSQNLCEMAGVTEGELLSESEDLYISLVHPADREVYSDFISRLKVEEQTLTCQYRLVKKDGSVLYISDTATSGRAEDGTPVACSVLADVTGIKKENNNLQFLNETIPCGFIKYTCEKQPRVTYINKQMMDFLRFPEAREGELDYLELYKDNVFLMIPIEERRRFALYLNRVYTAGAPIAGEMTLLRCDGTRAYMFGWVTKCVNEQGVEEFQSVCMDVTERHRAKKAHETKRYLKALADVYDKIFEYDLSNSTVNCLYGSNSAVFKWLENIPMQMEEATEKWIAGTVAEEDQPKVRGFFRDFFRKKLQRSGEKPPQITYRALSSDGELRQYSGIFLTMDHAVSLYCCRCVPEAPGKENVQELLMRFTDGIAAFEVTDEFVTPLYASENVCEFFGISREEWLPLMEKSTPIEEFVARSEAAYEEFAELLRNGEAEFTYFDLATERERRIKAICSRKSPGGTAPRYVMLYNVEEPEEAPGLPENRTVTIRTFGYFDVFVGEKPIAFRNKKSKELFALLVDRRGGYVSSEEAITFLWEDEPVNSVTLSRYRKVALRLKNILEEYGISEVVETVDGKRRIVPERVKCDLYDYLSGKEEFSQLFKGSYLSNYSWGETTLAELTGNILF